MSQLLILLIAIIFPLLLIWKAKKNKKIGLALFGLVLLFALPLSIHNQNTKININENYVSSYDYISKSRVNIKEYIKEKEDTNVSDYTKEASIIKLKGIESKSAFLKKIDLARNQIINFLDFMRDSNESKSNPANEKVITVNDVVYFNDKSKDFEIHIIDVGQGDSILLKKGDLEILVDAGPNEEGENVVKYLKGNFVKEIDLIVATHPHEDHIGGLDDVINNIPVKRIIDSGAKLDTKTYKDYIKAVKDSKADFIEDANIIYKYGDVSVQIIELGDDYKNTNDNSVVLIVNYANKNILLAGDLEDDLEEDLTEILKNQNVHIDFYKASHHGSKTSNSKELVDFIKPEIIAISAGVGNKYRHPNKDAMKVFLNNTNRVYSTQKSGNLKFIIKDEIIEAKDYYELLYTDSND